MLKNINKNICYGRTTLKKTYQIFSTLLFIALFLNCQSKETGDTPYVNGFDPIAIKDYRAEKDKYLKEAKDSPITEEDLKIFNGLSYYVPTNRFVFKAKLEPYVIPDTVKVYTSKKEDVRLMLKYAKLSFKYNDSTYFLNAYTSLKRTTPYTLFIPFADETSGKETYEAGRYIELEEKTGKNVYTLDFNYAYSPYCAYNKKYSCPLVPEGNYLGFEVKAGEKNYKQH